MYHVIQLRLSFGDSENLHLAAMAKQNTRKKKGSQKPGTEKEPSVEPQLIQKPNPFLKTPIYDLLHVFERAPDQWAARYILILSAIIVRGAVGLGLFSGKGEKPINGDFEAQRHWMEITNHLPISKWYFYDLQYWGLDYPPLTAYHLWLIGKIGSFINPTWFALDKSRGIESDDIKTFMRLSSIVSELIIFVPACLQLIYLLGKKAKLPRMHQIVVIALVLFQPPLLLIDHGHFQYNSVMLGFFLFAVIDLLKNNLMLASLWFMASIGFKQMALYYSPFVFFFILSKLFKPQNGFFATLKTFSISKLFLVGSVVIFSVISSVLPFIVAAKDRANLLDLLTQILKRMFPFERGIFEDKVANFWGVTNVAVKYNQLFSTTELKQLSLVLTVASNLPPCLMTFWKNVSRKSASPALVIYGVSACAWGFFLFSFQVHEKTVLVPLIPSTFLFLLSDTDIIALVQWINNVATFSLFPLLKKDGLVLQYGTTFALICWFLGGFGGLRGNLLWPKSFFWRIILGASYLAIAIFHVIEYSIPPPSQYPDLWVILNCTISFGCFALFYLWLLYRTYQL